ncbi:hypothetical protein PEBR_17813 [Penicillium brasilianum]|uniref:Uncharacterized protein n=1 Tax=Penicillium brasilianum TaxID=104259 RepID=A0A1S9RP83_PENBI|nr:hypothetical protein PEBR_17813 [Penicillium brasilianum]
MYFQIVYALFATAAVALPRGGNQQHHQGVDLPATSTASMSSSMSMPMKRATPTSMATPTPTMKVASPMRGEQKPEQLKAEKMMMLLRTVAPMACKYSWVRTASLKLTLMIDEDMLSVFMLDVVVT